MQVGFIVSLIFALIIAVFAIQNAQPVDISFFTLKVKASLALIILIATSSGAIILGFLGLYNKVKQGLTIKDLNKKINNLKKELKQKEIENEKLTTQLNDDLSINEYEEGNPEKNFENNTLKDSDNKIESGE